MEKRKVVVLNSGGFDSVVLCHQVKYEFEKDAEILGLHFLYGARNEKGQLEAVQRVEEKLGIHTDKIILDKFWWTNGSFYKSGEKQTDGYYLEYRNLIFLAYAVSYAQAKGADRIYLATYQGPFADTSREFIHGLNESIKLSGIRIISPYASYPDKTLMLRRALYYRIKPDDFFSCDTPIKGKLCHKCGDCIWHEEYEEYYNKFINNLPQTT